MKLPPIEQLPPERRFRLYLRIAGVLREAGAHEAAEVALDQAEEAARQSPRIRRAIDDLLHRAGGPR